MHRLKQTVEVKTTDHRGTLYSIGGAGIAGAIFLPLAPLTLWIAADSGNMKGKTTVRHDQEWGETRMIIELRRDGYHSKRLAITSGRFPSRWRPGLALLPRKPDTAELAEQMTGAARTAEGMSRARGTLAEIVQHSARTQKALLRRRWR